MQQLLDEFLADLHTFATGSYLQPQELEFWEPPYPVEALDKLRTLLETKLAQLTTAGESVPVLQELLVALIRFNDQYLGAVLEQEEIPGLLDILTAALQQADAATDLPAARELLNQIRSEGTLPELDGDELVFIAS